MMLGTRGNFIVLSDGIKDHVASTMTRYLTEYYYHRTEPILAMATAGGSISYANHWFHSARVPV